MRTLVLMFAVGLVGCGGRTPPVSSTVAPAPAAECPATGGHPRVTSDAATLDCEAVAFDFDTAQDLIVGFGNSTPDNFQLSLGDGIHVTEIDDSTDSTLEYRGTLLLTRSGDNLVRQVLNAFIYPTGWRWPHNPMGPSAALDSYRDSFRAMKN